MTTETSSDLRKTAHEPEERLSGNMGAIEVAMSVLAFSSPLTTVVGFIPVLLLFGGPTAPSIYLILTALLLVFTVGFVRMGASVKNPGGFYSFISEGIGKAPGLGAAALALFGYLLIGFFGAPFFGLQVQAFVADSLGGPDIPWYVWGIGVVILTTALAYNKIDLSAKVLTIVMLLEIVVVIIFNIFAFGTGAADGNDVSIAFPSFSDATLGLALLFALGNFLGFEATVIYRDEVKNPDRTIPRATYLAVAGIGIFYAIAAWAYIAVLGAGNAQAAAEANLAGLFTETASAMVGKIFADVVTVLLFTSVIAAILSIQNVSARYGFLLAKDRTLPAVMGRVHKRHKSPYISAVVVGAIWIVATVITAILGLDPVMIYTVAVGSGSFALIFLLTLASLAVFVFFIRRRKSSPESVWKTVIAPLVSFAGLAVVTYLAITNYKDLIGGDVVLSAVFIAITFLVAIAGTVYALSLKSRRPEQYARLGFDRPEVLLEESK